jgi:hypothetical protein
MIGLIETLKEGRSIHLRMINVAILFACLPVWLTFDHAAWSI